MARRLLLGLACLLLVAGPADGQDIHRKKRELDERISSLHSKIAQAHEKEGVLTSEIAVANARINGLVDGVSRAQAQLGALDRELSASQSRLDRLTRLFTLQTQRLKQLRSDYGVALTRLDRRLIEAYETPTPGAVDVLLSTTSMNGLLSDLEYLGQVGSQDRHISVRLKAARNEMQTVRARTRETKNRVADETAAIRTRRNQQQDVTAQLISTQQQLADARASKRATLASIKVDEQSFVRESQVLAAQSATLAARIQAAEAAAAAAAAAAARARAQQPASTSPSATPGEGAPAPSPAPSSSSSSGFIWPVQGPITSPFGSRCLPNGDCSFHPGIDIAVPAGTPIHAAAAGTVIYAGWMAGYGNLTVIDHGNDLATAYGHQSSIAVGVGAVVSQGQVIGYSGCTGYCFGPHVHFEVRVNGQPVDPLGYL